MTYSTQQLIEILDREMRATWKGERIILSSENRLNNPIVAKAIDLEKVGKVFAYRDFRTQVHEYQQLYGVSGIIWRQCTYNGRTLSYPEIHNQLTPVEGDKEILMAAKPEVIEFWHWATQDMNFWLAVSFRRPISIDSMEELIDEAQWAEIDVAQRELHLGLCWGNPLEHQYQWAKPHSGCHRIIAAIDQPSTIKV